MKRYFVLLLCLSLLHAPVFGMTVSANDSVTVRVGLYENSPKIFTDDQGNESGFWPDIIEYIASEEGWEIDYIHGTWEQSLIRLETNEIDVMPDVAYTEERSSLYDFSNETVYASWSRVYAKEGTGIQSILDLEGKTLAVLAGSVNVEGPEGIKELVTEFDINCSFVEVSSYNEVFELVESGEADAGVTNKDFYYQNREDYDIVRTAIIFQPHSLYFAFPKESSLTPYLIERIDYHMKELKEDEDSIYYQSLEKWLGVKPVEKSVIPGWIIWALAGIGGLVFLLAGGSFILRSQVRSRTKELTEETAERKQAEEQIKQLQEYLQLQIDRMPIALITWDTEFRVQSWNPSAEKIFGFTAEEALGKHPYELIVPKEAQPHVDNIWRRLLKGDTTAYSVNENATKDGQTIICDWTNTPLKKADGTVIGIISMVQDITESERAERALRESEERYRDLFDNANDLVQSVKPDGYFLYVNKKWREVLGYSEEEVTNLTLWDIIHSDSLPHCKEAFQRVMSGEVVSKIEAVFIAKDGRLVNVEGTSSCRFEDGKPVATRGIFRDITERKQAEEVLRKSEERYRDLFDNANDLIQSVAIDGQFLYVNQAWQNVLGYSAEEISNLKMWDIIHPDSMAHCMETFQKVMSGEAVSNLEVVFVAKDGSPISVEGNAHCLLEDGKPVATQGIFRDVTERKQAEEALRVSEERYRELANLLPQTICETDAEGNITYVNNNALDMFGYSPEDLNTGLTIWQMIAPGELDRAREDSQRVLRGGDLSGIEYTAKRKDGSTFPILIYASSVIREGNATGLRMIVVDITERKKMEEQLIVNDRLASIGELASGIAHELNNPLTSVIGFSDLLMDKDIPDDIKEDLKVINREAHRTAGVVRNLLIFARKHPQEKQPVDINKAIQAVLDLRAYEQRVSNIEVNTHFASDLPEITADGFQLQQVFINIIINAEHFMSEAHGKGTLTITTARVGDTIRASFTDDGPGIAKENLGHLFDPFFTTKEVGRGTGLGLSISHGIVISHGGKIYAESELGKGATFVVELPISKQ